MRYPPPIPQDISYTKFYCEENIYKLIEAFTANEEIRRFWKMDAVFISNPTKTVALWSQIKAGEENSPESVVIWDYHVIMKLAPLLGDELCVSTSHEGIDAGSWVYDFDSQLPMPCRSSEYLLRTFPNQGRLAEQYQSLFRVIPGQIYLDNFASDRSHMLQVGDPDSEQFAEQASYRAPPPPYPPLCGRNSRERGVTNNLMSHFVWMGRSDSGPNVNGTVVEFSLYSTE